MLVLEDFAAKGVDSDKLHWVGWLGVWLVGWLGVKLMMRIISDSIPTRGSEVSCGEKRCRQVRWRGGPGGLRGGGGFFKGLPAFATDSLAGDTTKDISDC